MESKYITGIYLLFIVIKFIEAQNNKMILAKNHLICFDVNCVWYLAILVLPQHLIAYIVDVIDVG